jgi:protein-glutamine gamma-glutamyltransferase
MALLLRLGGVPARVATGFSPGGFKRSQDEWVIRDRDAHSWVEAWYDGIGWVTFDPTPSATPARSLIAALNEEKAPEAADDAAVTASGGNAPGRNPAGARGELDPAAAATAAAPAAQQDGSSPAAPVLGGAALVALLAGIALHRRRARRRPSVPEAERALVELVRALRRAGRPIAPGTTLAELERRLGSARGGSAYLAALREARYRARAAPPSPGQRRALRRELAAGLGWRGRAQSWWALPPKLGRPRSG